MDSFFHFYITNNLIFPNVIEEGVLERIKRYLPMFGKILKVYPDSKDIIDSFLLKILKTFKRDDVASWMIKSFRDSISKRVFDDSLGNKDLRLNYNMYLSYINDIQHYLSLPIPSIQNYRFGTEDDITNVFSIFSKMEKEWQKENTRWIDITEELRDGEIEEMIKFPDGFSWFNLLRPYCEKEGEAMGHCGNTASPSDNDQILSLRKVENRKGKIFTRPSLTFILHEDNTLGETKGRGNTKPNEKYHPHILKLLTFRSRHGFGPFLIEGISGGGYLPESNFKLSDLSPEDSEELYRIRPELEPLISKYKRGLLSDEDVVKLMRKRINSAEDDIVEIITTPRNIKFVDVEWWDNSEDFLNDLQEIPRNLKTYSKYAFGETPLDVGSPETSILKEYMSDLLDDEIIRPKIIERLQRVLDDNMDDQDPNTLSPDEAFDMLQHDYDDIIDIMGSAYMNGMETGAYGSLIERFESGISNLECVMDPYSSDGVVFFPKLKEGLMGPVYMSMLISDALKFIENELIDETYINVTDGDMEVPYYGFNDFDEEVFISYIQNNI